MFTNVNSQGLNYQKIVRDVTHKQWQQSHQLIKLRNIEKPPL